MKYCNAVKDLTTEELNHIAHMLLEPWLLHQTVCRVNEEFQMVNIPEDIYIVFPDKES